MSLGIEDRLPPARDLRQIHAAWGMEPGKGEDRVPKAGHANHKFETGRADER
jgi:hypothetical protein